MLSKDEARLWVHIVSPQGAKFEIMDAKPLPTSPNPSEQNANTGIRKLAIHLSGVTSLSLAVEMVPLQKGESPPAQAGESRTDPKTTEEASDGRKTTGSARLFGSALKPLAEW